MASLEALVKEFTSSADDKKKAVLAQIEEEAGKLTGSSAKYLSLAYATNFPSQLKF